MLWKEGRKEKELTSCIGSEAQTLAPVDQAPTLGSASCPSIKVQVVKSGDVATGAFRPPLFVEKA